MAYGDFPPALGGVELPKPNGIQETPEPVGSEVQLAGGALRRYDGGIRQVFQLAWNKATEATRDLVVGAVAQVVTSYRHTDGRTYVVLTSPPSWEPIAATDPVRFPVSLTLREQAPQR